MGEIDFLVSNKWFIDKDDVRCAYNAEAGFKRIKPNAIFRIMHSGLILKCIDVIKDDNDNIIKVIAETSNEKPSCAIHGLSVENCFLTTIIEPDIIPTENSNPDDYIKTYRAYMHLEAKNYTSNFQAPRFAWLIKDPKNPNIYIVSTKLKSSI